MNLERKNSSETANWVKNFLKYLLEHNKVGNRGFLYFYFGPENQNVVVHLPQNGDKCELIIFGQRIYLSYSGKELLCQNVEEICQKR